MYMHVTKPMDDSAIKRVTAAMFYVNTVLFCASTTLVLYYVFGQEDEHRELTKMGLDTFLKPGVIITMCVSTMAKLWVTTLSGVDFVVGEISSQRNFEVYLETGNDRGEKGYMSRANMTAGEVMGVRERIKQMMGLRNSRLDDLCKANRKTYELEFGENEFNKTNDSISNMT